MNLPILAYTRAGYAAAVRKLLNKGQDHAALLHSGWLRSAALPYGLPAFDNGRKLVRDIVSLTDFTLPQISGRFQQGETEKFRLRLSDGYEIESVVIPMRFGWSLCLSSQVGCRMGCTFCRTGRMGLLRHLSVQEIVAQLFIARHQLGYPIRNLVFMGMGEPMDNFEAVLAAIEVISDSSSFGIAKKHITISTSGRVDGIRKMAASCDSSLKLAVSINAPNDLIRTKIMPLNRKFAMEELKAALYDYCSHPKRAVFIEYVLLKDVNDDLASADQLAAYLEGLRVKVNLIPYNPQDPDRYSPPPSDVTELFAARMRSHGYQTFFRGTKGRSIMAACGQLAIREQRAARVDNCRS